MSTKPENVFVTSVHRHLPPVDELHREKMANPYRGGTADWWYSAGTDLWVEYKFIKVPVRGTSVINLVSGGKKPKISALQADWLRERYDEGRNVWVIVGCKDGGVILTARRWEQPLTAEEFRQRLVSRKEVAAELQEFLETA